MKYYKYVLGTLILLVLGIALLFDPGSKIGCADSAEIAVRDLRLAMQLGNINHFEKALHKRLAILNYIKSFSDGTKNSSSSSEAIALQNASKVYKYIYDSVVAGKISYRESPKCSVTESKPFSNGLWIEYTCLNTNKSKTYFHYAVYKRRCGWVVGGFSPGEPYISKSLVE